MSEYAPEAIQAIHDAWVAQKAAEGRPDPGFPGEDGGLYYSDDDEFWAHFDAPRGRFAPESALSEAYVEQLHPRDRLGKWRRKFGLGVGRKVLHDSAEVLSRLQSEGRADLPHGTRIEPPRFQEDGYEVLGTESYPYPDYRATAEEAVELATRKERGALGDVPPMPEHIESLIVDALDDPDVKLVDKGGGGDLVAALAIESQGKGGPPRLISDAEFDRMLAAGEITEFWRGVPEVERAEQFAHGDLHVWPGNYGSGIYVTNVRRAAEVYAGGGSGVVMRIGLPANARVATTDEIDKLRKETWDLAYAQYAKVNKHPDATGRDKKIAKAIYIAQIDPGVLAAMAGYDMIDATEGADWDKPTSPYYVLLNRSGIVLSEVFREHG